MKMLCVIDHFGAGGAQRQMAELALGLKLRGHEVHVFIYYPKLRFFLPRLETAGVIVHAIEKGPGFSLRVLRALIAVIRRERFDAIVSFLDRPNVYAELATLLSGSGSRLLVSERSSHRHDRSRVGSLMKRVLHGVAKVVVVNSLSHRDWLSRYAWLRSRLACVYNGMDLDKFKAGDSAPALPQDLRLIAIGRVGPEKNTLLLVEALRRHGQKFGWIPQLTWVGRDDESPEGAAYRQAVDRALENAADVAKRWVWLGERRDVPELLAQHHALVHPALYEGLPNVVCEALASGRPVLASAVGDNAQLVSHGERGFVFEPTDVQGLLAAIEALHGLTTPQWTTMGRAARRYAEETLSAARMVARFESLMLAPGAHARSS